MAAVRATLTAWLARQLPGADGLTLSELKKPSAGVSNETLLAEADWREAGRAQHERLVVRLMPSASPVFPDYDLGKQVRILRCLESTNVPVPRVLWFEEDERILGSPFYVMPRIEGELPSEVPPYHAFGWCAEISPARQARMWWSGIETLARIHLLNWQRLGLGFLDVDQLDYYEHYLAWGRGETPQPILDATLAWLKAHRPKVEHRTLCWGDSRLPNMIFREQETVGVLDWEMAFIGDPEADLGWWLFMDWSHSTGYGIPRLPGLPSAADTVARYEELTQRQVRNARYWEVFAAYRYGVITMKIARALKGAGFPAPDDMETNNSCTQRLAQILDLPPPGRARAVTDINAVTARVQFHLTGPGGSDFVIVSDKGEVSLQAGAIADPDTTLTVAAADWLAIQTGELNRTDAFLSGKLKIDGDPTLLMQLEGAIAKLTEG